MASPPGPQPTKSSFVGQYNMAFLPLTDDDIFREYSDKDHRIWTSGGTLPLVSTTNPHWCPPITRQSLPEEIPNSQPRTSTSQSDKVASTLSIRLHGALCINTWHPAKISLGFLAPYLGFSNVDALKSFCLYEGRVPVILFQLK